MTYEIITCHSNAKDITGQVFGRLTAIAPVVRTPESTIKWLCICECSSECVIYIGNLIKGFTQSCGCIRREMKNSLMPEYSIWTAMKQRCRNPHDLGYKNYGGRGITVCDRWDNFASFISDMGLRPSNKHSIDRIDNDGDYTTENCRWATSHEQSRNKRSNRIIRFAGKEKCAADWEDEIGISAINILNRIDACGWSIERALTEPVKIRGKYKHHV